jgi:hypothetical protein
METAVIKKRLNTFKTAKGTLKDVANDVVMEVLRGWETWPGKTAEYYREIGLSRMQMVNMIKKGKRLVKSGAVTESEFKEIAVPPSGMGFGISSGALMEVKLEGGKAVAFTQVDALVEFLKKMA